MKLELSIKDDKELRTIIKDMVKGTVVSIIRMDLSGMIQKTLGTAVDKMLTTDMARFDERLRAHKLEQEVLLKKHLESITSKLDKHLAEAAQDFIRNRAVVVLRPPNIKEMANGQE